MQSVNPSITVLPHKFVKAWPKPHSDPGCACTECKPWKDDPRAVVATAGAVLTEVYSTDAHFVCYASDFPRRHRVALFQDRGHVDRIKTANVRMTLATFDVDGPDHKKTPEWWAAEQPKIAALLEAHPGGFIFPTLGGYRPIFALAKAFPLFSQLDDDAWTARYLSWCRYLARRFGIHADQSCADWTRPFRAPYVVRDGVPQRPEVIGDPFKLGVWKPTLAPQDRVRPKAASEVFGAVEPVPVGDLNGRYAFARINAGVEYLQTAPLVCYATPGVQRRDKIFGVAGKLVRRLRLPIDVAGEAWEQIYNVRLRDAGLTPWPRSEPGTYGMCIDERLVAAAKSGTIPPGDVPDEKLWNELAGVGVEL
jgi:hypothetical protein